LFHLRLPVVDLADDLAGFDLSAFFHSELDENARLLVCIRRNIITSDTPQGICFGRRRQTPDTEFSARGLNGEKWPANMAGTIIVPPIAPHPQHDQQQSGQAPRHRPRDSQLAESHSFPDYCADGKSFPREVNRHSQRDRSQRYHD
jgi:hypothetical protein